MKPGEVVWVASIVGDVSGHFVDQVVSLPACVGESLSVDRVQVDHKYVATITVMRPTMSAAVTRAKELWVHEQRRMDRDLRDERQPLA